MRSKPLKNRKQKRGSVLLIVVVLLLMMAILGSTFLVSSRVDRVVSGQDLTNSQIDQLSDAAKELVMGQIAGALFDNVQTPTGQFRVASLKTFGAANTPYTYLPQLYSSSAADGAYRHFDSAAFLANYVAGATSGMLGSDIWLADRVPILNSAGAYAWGSITGPLLPSLATYPGTTNSGAPAFEDPTSGLTYNPYTNLTAAATCILPATPTSVTVKNTNGVVTGTYPALKFSASAGAQAPTFVAGDADGDGIADCGLMRLPGVYADGITYYLGLRIIDNNSAINVNTAWDDNSGTPTQPESGGSSGMGSEVSPSSMGMFPSSVGLYELLDMAYGNSNATQAGYDSLRLTQFRFGLSVSPGTPTYTPPTTFPLAVVDDNGVARSDLGFASQEDAFYQLLARRPGNPGLFAVGTPMRALGDADAASMAYHFGFLNPTLEPSSPMTLIDQVLNWSCSAAPNGTSGIYSRTTTNYPTTLAWQTADFPYLLTSFVPNTTPFNARPLLTTKSTTSNYAPAPVIPGQGAQLPSVPAVVGMLPLGDRGRWQPWVTYSKNDVVTFAFTTTTSGELNYRGNELSSQVYYSLVSGNVNQPPLSTTGTVNANWTITPPATWTPPAYAAAVKANVNTASFPELWRAYFSVMYPGEVAAAAAGAPGGNDDVATSAVSTNLSMFRPTTRSKTTLSTPIMSTRQMALLRAAIAAINTESLRSPDPINAPRNIIAREVSLGTAPTSITAVVYGYQPQPFITEVYAQTDTTARNLPAGIIKPNPLGYVAVELFNPYSFDIPLVTTSVPQGESAWQIAAINRTSSPMRLANTTAINFDPTYYSATTVNKNGLADIPAHGYLLMENYAPPGANAPGADPAVYRPVSSGLPSTGAIQGTNGTPRPPFPPLNTVYVPGLSAVLPYEMVIMRRRHANGIHSTASDGGYNWDDSKGAVATSLSTPTNLTGIYDYVPVDSFDFSNMLAPFASGSAQIPYAEVLHYERVSIPGSAATNWDCVYPGTYNPGGTPYFQTGTELHEWHPSPTDKDPGVQQETTSLGTQPFSSSAYTNVTGPTPTLIQGAPLTIQLDPSFSAWSAATGTVTGKPVASPTVANPNYFPFGGFARNGDILQVPFIGAYRLQDASGNLIELNSMTMDAAFANDNTTGGGPSVDAYEQVGRFCPIFEQAAATTYAPAYAWAASLFDYLTVQGPRDDYLPNTDPDRYLPYTGSTTTPGTPALKPLPVANSDASLSVPKIMTGSLGPPTQNPASPATALAQAQYAAGNKPTALGANTNAEDAEPVQGLVNINTAPWPVLASLPLVVDPGAAGTVDQPLTDKLAQAIVAYRTANGPFTSIFDLNKVSSGGAPVFQNGENTLFLDGKATLLQGNLNAVANPTTGNGIPDNYDELYLQVNRLSNLITTRSDSFTVYAVIEGWQNAGTTNATLAVTRRFAFIVDRSSVTPMNRTPKVVYIPNN
jgi:DNA uptake protein ComE-like DNA-binding protein